MLTVYHLLAVSNEVLSSESAERVRNIFLDPESFGLIAVLGAIALTQSAAILFLFLRIWAAEDRVWKKALPIINDLRDENAELRERLTHSNNVLNKFAVVQDAQTETTRLLLENHARALETKINELGTGLSEKIAGALISAAELKKDT